jgi:5-methylcytosine-specific restriction protein A
VPSKPKKPCSYPRCPELTLVKYCDNHQDKDKQRHKIYDQHQRDKKAAAFYNSKEWERSRLQALIRDYYLCQHCLKEKIIKLADMVDHIIPIKIAWHLRVFLNNLQSLCYSCHTKKTLEDKKKYGRVRQ